MLDKPDVLERALQLFESLLQRSGVAYRNANQARGDPRRLIPIFRDRDELASSGDLSATIQQALADSENLIVIRLPAAAEPHSVNEEIRQFKQSGRGDRVFCLLVGDPKVSFPPNALVDVDGDGFATLEETEPRKKI